VHFNYYVDKKRLTEQSKKAVYVFTPVLLKWNEHRLAVQCCIRRKQWL